MPAPEADATQPLPPAARVSPRDAVRHALRELGDAAPNAELVRFVKERYGVDVTTYISQYKNAARKIDRREAGQGAAPAPERPAAPRRSAGRPRRAKPAAASAPTGSPPTPSAGPAPSADLTALADLAARHGTAEVRRMLDALERFAATR